MGLEDTYSCLQGALAHSRGVKLVLDRGVRRGGTLSPHAGGVNAGQKLDQWEDLP